ncbi:hypothetical protein D3C75_1133380 [compost metagenome]
MSRNAFILEAIEEKMVRHTLKPVTTGRILKGSLWECINPEAEEFGQKCTVADINDNPDYNGDGDIELLFEDGSKLYKKVRRFWAGVDYKLVEPPQE